MAKRRTFEELLNAEFRWPKTGDSPFVVADDPLDNARIETNGFARLVLMMEGYKKGADLLVEEAEKDRAHRDFLVFPIIFNYRQFIELSLKYQLATYGPKVGIEPNWNSHRLESLWEEFLEMLERFGSTDPDEADPIVASIVLEFAKIDPESYSYRYPVDKRGRPLPVAHNDLHLPTLADVMEAVAGYFTGCDRYLDSLVSAGP